MANQALEAAFAAYTPRLAEVFTRQSRSAFAQMVADCGPTLKGVYNHNQHARTYRAWLAAFVDRGSVVSGGVRKDTDATINEARLAACATTWAEQTIAAWADKINAKLGAMDEVKVASLLNDRFTIIGTRAGRTVRIEQDRIVQRSTKGLLFNQFPSRIYLDGKFTPEAKYHATFA